MFVCPVFTSTVFRKNLSKKRWVSEKKNHTHTHTLENYKEKNNNNKQKMIE